MGIDGKLLIKTVLVFVKRDKCFDDLFLRIDENVLRIILMENRSPATSIDRAGVRFPFLPLFDQRKLPGMDKLLRY